MEKNKLSWFVRKQKTICLIMVIFFIFTNVTPVFAFRLWGVQDRSDGGYITSRHLWESGFSESTPTPYNIAANDKLLLRVGAVDTTVTFATVTTNPVDAANKINIAFNGPPKVNAKAIVVDNVDGDGAVMLRSTADETITIRRDPAGLQWWRWGGTANHGGPGDSTATREKKLKFYSLPALLNNNRSVIAPSDLPPFNHWDHRRFRWDGTNFKVPYSINTTGANLNGPLMAGSDDATTAIKNAFKSWEDVSPAIIGFESTGTTALRASALDHWNIVAFDDLNSTRTMARTSVWIDVPTGRILEADIILNNNVGLGANYWTSTDTPSIAPAYRRDIQATVAHEIGHFIGIGHVKSHNNANDPIMSYSAWLDRHPLDGRNLKADDQNAANFLYTPDIGDAPDPYPAKTRGAATASTLNNVALLAPLNGAEHLFGYQPSGDAYEWLGNNIEKAADAPEGEAKQDDKDEHDDGVVFGNLKRGKKTWVKATVNINNIGNHTGKRYLNAWIDFNGDKDWNDANEKIINGVVFATAGTTIRQFDVNIPADAPTTLWARFRLDYGENVGTATSTTEKTLNQRFYAAQFGEVEDLKIMITASDPPTGADTHSKTMAGFIILFAGVALLIVRKRNQKPV